MVSELDRAKRALVTLIKSLAALYSVVVEVVRDSDDAVMRGAFRKVFRKVEEAEATAWARLSPAEEWGRSLEDPLGEMEQLLEHNLRFGI